MEKMLSKALHRLPEAEPSRLSQDEVMKKFNISQPRLKQLRLGYKGKPPVLFLWGSINGRHIDYDVKELERYFKRSIAFQ